MIVSGGTAGAAAPTGTTPATGTRVLRWLAPVVDEMAPLVTPECPSDLPNTDSSANVLFVIIQPDGRTLYYKINSDQSTFPYIASARSPEENNVGAEISLESLTDLSRIEIEFRAWSETQPPQVQLNYWIADKSSSFKTPKSKVFAAGTFTIPGSVLHAGFSNFTGNSSGIKEGRVFIQVCGQQGDATMNHKFIVDIADQMDPINGVFPAPGETAAAIVKALIPSGRSFEY